MFDFIERYVHVAPDNGDGSIEVFLVISLIILFAAIALRLMITKNRPS
jgi:hypothetical protein